MKLLNNLKRNNMNKEFIPYEQALSLKELGFDEPCLDFYDDNKELFYNHENKEKIHIGDSVKAPLYQQALRWFREKYGLDSAVLENRYVIETKEDLPNWYYGFKTYEESELACLIKLIGIVKNK